MDEKLSINIPARFNLFDWVTTPPFKESKQAFSTIIKKKIKKIFIGLLLLGGLALIVLLIYFSGHRFIAVIVAFFGVCALVGVASGSSAAANTFQEAKEEHCKKVVEELVNNNFPGFVYFYYEDNALIYNNDIFAYLSTKTGLLVLYGKGNMKSMEIKRVKTDKFGFIYETNGTSTTVRQGLLHEYRMEMMTDFIECPIITIKVGDTPYYFNELKKAMAILS